MGATIKELKNFLTQLPEEFDDFTMVNGEYGIVDKDSDEFYYRIDKPIVTLYIDENSRELCLLHQTEKEVDDIIDSVKGKEEDGNQE